MRRPPPHRAVLSLVPLLIGPPLLAQSAWTKAPALPTACYSEQDTFDGDAEKARTELEAAIERQEQINRGLQEQAVTMDPATLNQRMMAAVQKNPARAQEIMQAMQSMGQGTAAEEEESEFSVRKAELIAGFEAEYKALVGSTSIALEDRALAAKQKADYNRKYATVVCPPWFGKQMPEFLASYRAYLVEQRIPKRAELETRAVAFYELLGLPTKDFRPIAELRGVLDYLRFASDLFGLREKGPYKAQ